MDFHIYCTVQEYVQKSAVVRMTIELNYSISLDLFMVPSVMFLSSCAQAQMILSRLALMRRMRRPQDGGHFTNQRALNKSVS